MVTQMQFSRFPIPARANLLGGFLRNSDGNFALIMALLLVPVLGAAGMAVDVVSLMQTKVELQNALDAGVLAVAAKKARTLVVDKALAMAYFSGNSAGWNIAALTFVENADGSLTGNVSIDAPTHFMGIFGIKTVRVALSSTANALTETKLSQVKLNIVHAQGAFSKDIYFFTRNKEGALLSESLVLTYRYDGKNKILTPPSSSSITVNVGDYASYGYSMVVYEDLNYKGALNNPKKHYSDDADAAKWIRTSGSCADTNGVLNQWEDGGDGNYLDFQFNQKCTSTTTNLTDVRLLR